MSPDPSVLACSACGAPLFDAEQLAQLHENSFFPEFLEGLAQGRLELCARCTAEAWREIDGPPPGPAGPCGEAMNDVRMSLLPDGTVLHDYGAGSCFSCGGTVHATHDHSGDETAICTRCGPVRYLTVANDAGGHLCGFMTPADFKAWWARDHFDPNDIPF